MYEFEYHRPADVAAAKTKMGACEDGKLLAGGMTLLPTLKLRLAQPSDLIDLNGIGDLRGVRRDGESLIIGAMTTHASVAKASLVTDAIPALAELAGHIGDPQVRNRGTIGGSIANNDPAADYPAAVVALNATVATDRREIAADDFFTDMFETALDEQEIITAVRFPVTAKAAYMKFPNPASRYALVGVMVAVVDGDVRVAVTGAAPCVFRYTEMEQALAGNFSPDAIAGIQLDESGLNADIHASAAYRAHLVNVMARRAVSAAQ